MWGVDSGEFSLVDLCMFEEEIAGGREAKSKHTGQEGQGDEKKQSGGQLGGGPTGEGG